MNKPTQSTNMSTLWSRLGHHGLMVMAPNWGSEGQKFEPRHIQQPLTKKVKKLFPARIYKSVWTLTWLIFLDTQAKKIWCKLGIFGQSKEFWPIDDSPNQEKNQYCGLFIDEMPALDIFGEKFSFSFGLCFLNVTIDPQTVPPRTKLHFQTAAGHYNIVQPHIFHHLLGKKIWKVIFQHVTENNVKKIFFSFWNEWYYENCWI